MLPPAPSSMRWTASSDRLPSAVPQLTMGSDHGGGCCGGPNDGGLATKAIKQVYVSCAGPDGRDSCDVSPSGPAAGLLGDSQCH